MTKKIIIGLICLLAIAFIVLYILAQPKLEKDFKIIN